MNASPRLLLRLSASLAGLGLAFAAVGCGSSTSASDGPLFFATPEAAVEVATPLLQAKDWATLARYYDLAGSNVARAELENGSFFFSDRGEGAPHPSGISRYKHPFAPGFRFLSSEAGPQADTAKVVVQLEIDQGAGVPPQRARAAFLLRRSAQGYQLLPARIDP